MKNKTLKLIFLLLLGGLLGSCGIGAPSSSPAGSVPASSAAGASSAGSSASSTGASSSQGTNSSNGGASSSSGPGSTSSSSSTSSPSGPSLPDQTYRTIAVNTFKQAKIAIDINKLLGVSFTQGNRRKNPNKRSEGASEAERPLNFAECFLKNEKLRHGPSAEGTGESERTLVSTKDSTFKPCDADPYYYTGIQPDGSDGQSLLEHRPFCGLQDHLRQQRLRSPLRSRFRQDLFGDRGPRLLPVRRRTQKRRFLGYQHPRPQNPADDFL
jgi:hypothetical protein